MTDKMTDKIPDKALRPDADRKHGLDGRVARGRVETARPETVEVFMRTATGAELLRVARIPFTDENLAGGRVGWVTVRVCSGVTDAPEKESP